jgi:hypothetical protein
VKLLNIIFIFIICFIFSAKGEQKESFLASIWTRKIERLDTSSISTNREAQSLANTVAPETASKVDEVKNEITGKAVPINLTIDSRKYKNASLYKTLDKNIQIPVIIGGIQQGSMTIKRGQKVLIADEISNSYVVVIGKIVCLIEKTDILDKP